MQRELSLQTNQKLESIDGFSRTWHPFQILSYIIFVQSFISFYLIIVPSYSMVLKIVSTFLYSIFSLCIVYFTWKATNTDPTDNQVIKEKERKLQKITGNVQILSESDFFCNQCDSHVSGTSKHCRICDRCVQNFDHHCKWLNNCIGEKNYSYFFKLILFVSCHCSIYLGFALPVIIFNKDLYIVYSIWIMVNIAVVGIMTFLTSNLLMFHIWLQNKQLSTYDYIVSRREMKQKIQLAKHAKTLKTMPSNVTDILISPRVSTPDMICGCIKRTQKIKRGIVIPEPDEGDEHKIINVSQFFHIKYLNNKGVCNDIDVVKTQTISDEQSKMTKVKVENVLSQSKIVPIIRLIKQTQQSQQLGSDIVEDPLQRARRVSNSLTENSINDDDQLYKQEFFNGELEASHQIKRSRYTNKSLSPLPQ